MFGALARDFRLAPLTFSLLTLSAVLFIAVEFHQTGNNDPLAGRRTFGAVDALIIRGEKDLHGPFDLWDGPWWRWLRIPASAFHHANLLHLFCNASMLWYLGPLLERRMRRVSCLAFWLSSATVSLLPEFYLDHYPVGLSGVACAMFGWCLLERRFDPVVAARVHDGAVKNVWMFLFLCVILTIFDVLPVANVAHFTGVGYGWLVARATQTTTARWAMLAGHVLLVPAIGGVLHPVWNGRYHALLGVRTLDRERDLTAAVPHFREAVRHEPGLPRAWLRLAAERAAHGEQLTAWRFVIDGLHHNRSNEELTDFAQKTWRFLPASDRDEARKYLQQRFAADAEAWSKRLKLTSEPLVDAQALTDEAARLLDAVEANRLFDVPDDIPAMKRSQPKRRVDPDDPDSATEGRTL